MASIIKVNDIQDAGGNSIISSNGSGTFTPSSALATGVLSNTPAFSAYLSANQNITSSTNTKIQFDTEILDTDNCYDNSTNYRFTPTTAGKYFVFSKLLCNANDNSQLIQARNWIYKNGGVYEVSYVHLGSNNGRYVTVNVSGVIDMNGSTDYLEIYGLISDSSGTPTVTGSSSEIYSTFGAYKIIGA